MDITKLDIKGKLLAGSAMAVMSGFVPPVANHATAASINVPIDVQIVTAITLDNANGLDFGRLAITGVMTGSNHTLSPGGATTTGAGYTVAVSGTPGSFEVTGGTAAGNVQVSYPTPISFNAGNIALSRFTLAGAAFVAPVQVAAGGTAAANLAGGGNTAVNVGAQLTFAANPTVGTYGPNNLNVVIVDVP